MHHSQKKKKKKKVQLDLDDLETPAPAPAQDAATDGLTNCLQQSFHTSTDAILNSAEAPAADLDDFSDLKKKKKGSKKKSALDFEAYGAS